MAADLPTSVLADILGLHISSVLSWQRHARRDWADYLAARREERFTT
ncbi:hypothetical protein [Nonomuraea sp. LPB2021202275-12-8]